MLATCLELATVMHPNPSFRRTGDENIAFARKRSFGTLAINGEHDPLLSHIPFQLSEGGESLEAHLLRSNPIVRVLGKPQSAAVSVLGADAYISPDWYGTKDQVPTWNYVAVHLRGTLRLGEAGELPGVLERLSQNMEERLLPKPVWKHEKMSDGIFERMCRQIVPIFMKIETIDGTWKLSQNKPEGVPTRAANCLAQNGFGSEIAELARLMKSAEPGE